MRPKEATVLAWITGINPVSRPVRVLRAALLLGAWVIAVPAHAQTAGESWEYTGSMEMEGMKMPIPPTRACALPGETGAPPVDPRCKITDLRASGNKTAFQVVCGPPEPMQGSGESTRTGDRIDTRYRLKSSQGEMVMTLNGRKVGTCTPGR